VIDCCLDLHLDHNCFCDEQQHLCNCIDLHRLQHLLTYFQDGETTAEDDKDGLQKAKAAKMKGQTKLMDKFIKEQEQAAKKAKEA